MNCSRARRCRRAVCAHCRSPVSARMCRRWKSPGCSWGRMVESPARGAGTMARMQRGLITAGASGIGRELVHGFMDAGARVAVLDVDATALAALRAELPEVIAETCDLAER